MMSNMPIHWVCFYAVFVALWAYRCSRGQDGHLGATVLGFGVFAILYLLTVYWHRPLKFSTFLLHLVIFEIAAIIALVVNPQLDEMGRILYIMIPSVVLAIVLGGFILSWLFWNK